MPAVRTSILTLVPILVTSAVYGIAPPLKVAPQEQLKRDDNVATKEAILSALARLDSADVEARVDAQRDLRWLVGRDMKSAESLLARPDLSPEQIERLTTVGFGVFSTQPRAAMGVRFGLVQGGAQGVTIDGAIAGFDSARVLQPGDAIRTIAGEPVHEQMDARRIIISFDPGDEVPVELMRDGQVRDVRVRLGAFAELRNNQAAVDAPSLRLAWETRLSRIRQAGTPNTLECGVSAQRAATLRAFEAQARSFSRTRNGAQPEKANDAVGDGPAATAGGTLRGVGMSFNRPFRVRPAATIDDAELMSELDQADKWAEQVRSLDMVLRDPATPYPDRRRFEVNRGNNLKAWRELVERRRDPLRRRRAMPGGAD